LILTADYHTHTPYSHGKNTVEENVLRAKELGMQEIGIADHGFAHLAFGVKRKAMKNYKSDCEKAEKAHGVRVRVGLETNILGVSGKVDLTVSDYDDLDVFLCGKHNFVAYETLGDWTRYCVGNFTGNKIFHYTSESLKKRNTLAYINAIKNNPIDILTHINYVCKANALEVAKCAEDYGTYLELNSKKQHLSDDELAEIAVKTSVRFVIDSDAHSASRVGEIRLVEEQLKRIGFPLDRIDNINGRLPSFRFTAFKEGK
jgi:putative hydrolase